jgi:hypothetical protein
MEPDWMRMEIDSDISDIRLHISFQFTSLRMETDSDISDIYFSIFFPFPSLYNSIITTGLFEATA